MASLRFTTIGVLAIAILTSVDGRINRSKDPKLESKKDFVKKMMKDAWDTYATHAWGDHSVIVTTRRPDYNGGVPGKSKCGATIIAALDTLHIMGLDEEFDRAKDWVKKDLNFSSIEAEIYQSEIVGVHIGGLLSAYFLTNEQIFLERAQELATIDLVSFNPYLTGIPHNLINLATARARETWTRHVPTSTLGQVCAVFNSLWNLTRDGRFKEKPGKLRAFLQNQHDKLFPDYIPVNTGGFAPEGDTNIGHVSLMSTFLNEWLLYGDTNAKLMYNNMTDAILKNGLIKTSHRSQLRYLSSRSSRGIVVDAMNYQACMAAGVFALGATSDTEPKANSTDWLRIGKEIAQTCFFVSNKTASGLAPYDFAFNTYAEGESLRSTWNGLDPNIAYSYFILYRLTGDSKYRQWGWQMAKAIQKSARDPHGGYGPVSNVSNPHSRQPLPLLGGTLKFLYLLFCDSDYFSLDDWVYDIYGNLMPTGGGRRPKTHTSNADSIAGRSSGSMVVLCVAILIILCVAVAFAWKRYWPRVKAPGPNAHTGIYRGARDADDDVSPMVYGRL